MTACAKQVGGLHPLVTMTTAQRREPTGSDSHEGLPHPAVLVSPGSSSKMVPVLAATILSLKLIGPDPETIQALTTTALRTHLWTLPTPENLSEVHNAIVVCVSK